MVVESKHVELGQLDLAYLGFFVGRRVNELVVQRLIKAGYTNVRETHGYVLQHLIGSERSISDLARRMGVTQQAASKTIAEMVHLGILEATTAADRRAKMIQISARGWDSIHFSRRARAQIDRRLTKAVGIEDYRRVRDCLVACLAELGGVQRVRSRRVPQPR
jgi:DNA-binding MarR family transcriptional regulator